VWRSARRPAGRTAWRPQGRTAERGRSGQKDDSQQRRRHRHRDVLGPLAVRRPGVRLQGHRRPTLQLAGNLTARECLNAVAPGLLVHIVDQLTGRRFLVDTGASYSIFPHQSSSPLFGPSLTGPSGKRISCWGEQLMELSFHGRRFTWTFLLADVQFAIIGIDFLRSHQLLVNPSTNRLVDTASLQAFAKVSAPTASACAACRGNQQDSKVSPSSTAAAVAGRQDSRLSPPPTIAAEAARVDSRISPPSAARAEAAAAAEAPPPLSPQWVKEFLEEFANVVCASKVLPPVGADVEHHIETTGPPIAARFRSPWSSPLHMVRKADGSWRPCGDFRRLNLVTVADFYPLPNMLDFASKAAGCTIFSKIDLRKGYHQIPVHPALNSL
jgi:hypothetical protein